MKARTGGKLLNKGENDTRRDLNNVKRLLESLSEGTWHLATARHRYAIQRIVLIICEITHLGLDEAFKANHPSLPWEALKHLRAAVVHQSHWLDETVFAQEALQDMPKLLPLINALLTSRNTPKGASVPNAQFMQQTIKRVKVKAKARNKKMRKRKNKSTPKIESLNKDIRNLERLIKEINFLQDMLNLNYEKKGRQAIKKNIITKRATEMAIIRIASIVESGLSERFPKRQSKIESQYTLNVKHTGKTLNWQFLIKLRVRFTHYYFRVTSENVLIITQQMMCIKPFIEKMLLALKAELEAEETNTGTVDTTNKKKKPRTNNKKKYKTTHKKSPSLASGILYTGVYRREEIAFLESNIAGDGSCGFSVLDVGRVEVVRELLKLSDNAITRAAIAPVIEQALMSGEHGIEFLLTDEWQQLKQQHATTQQALGNVVRNVNDAVFGDNDDRRLRQDELSEWLFNVKSDSQFTPRQQRQFTEHSQRLLRARLAFAQAEADIKDYCEREDVYKSYVQQGLGGSLWLDYHSMLAYGKQRGIKVVIWEVDNTLTNTLKVRKESLLLRPPQQVIHVLHTGHYTHYNRLMDMSSFEAEYATSPISARQEEMEESKDDTSIGTRKTDTVSVASGLAQQWSRRREQSHPSASTKQHYTEHEERYNEFERAEIDASLRYGLE